MRILRNLVSVSFLLTSLAALAQNESSSTFWIWNAQAGLKTNHQCQSSNLKPSQLPAFYSKLQDQVIEIKDLPQHIQDDTSFFSLIGSFWQAVQNNGQLATVRCQDQDYVLFDVLTADFAAPIARIAVPAKGNLLFQTIELHSVAEAESRLAALSTEATPLRAMEMAADVETTEGSVDYVVCTSGSTTNVRDQSLTNVLFAASKYESLKMVQSFGTDRQQKTINGVLYYFQKVQFPNRNSSNNIGWMADNFIKLRSQCAGAPNTTNPVVTPGAWTFPTTKRPTDNYKTGMRAYGASRSGGRLHAAADLYRAHGDPAVAVTTGKIIRDKYYFYEGTYAIEVQHTGGKVVRYGEITGTSAPNIALGKTVQTGQTVGYIGTVNSGCCKPMLHFEMYAGTATGALTQSGNKYSRRSDLMNPSSLLTNWEKEKFGISY